MRSDYPLETEKRADTWYLTSPNLQEKHGIMIVFTSRKGGISKAPFNTLNLGYQVGDNPEAVKRNREHLCTLLGLGSTPWILAEQVHGAEIAQVPTGSQVCQREMVLPQVDGLVAREEPVALVLLFADCVPVVLVHPATRTVGIAHAGWKGTLERISEALVSRVKRLSGADPAEHLGFVGPSIGACCYQVDSGRGSAFSERLGMVSKEGKSIDLAGANVDQLVRTGMRPESIEIAGVCTSCRSEEFFSFRASAGVTGRQAGLVALL